MPNTAPTSIASALTDETIARALTEAGDRSESDPALERALTYARGRYAAGIARYADAVERLGFRGMERVLDVGCGVGQWSLPLATQNEKVVGIDLRPEYVDVATTLAVATGLTSRAQFRGGVAETLPEASDSTDGVFCHMVLMWIPERELAVANLARCLRDGGLLYLAYTTPAMLLRSIAMTDRADTWERARIPAATLLSNALYSLGAFATFGSRVRAYEPGELERLVELFGLTVEESPHVEDGPHDWSGHRLSGDFLARKETAVDAFEHGFPTDSDDLAERLDDLVKRGAPRLALRLLDRIPARGRELAALQVEALLKAGELARAGAELEELPADGHRRLRGLHRLQSGDGAAAKAEFSAEDPGPDRDFLLACAHLLAKDTERAAAGFRAELAERPGSPRALAGAVLAALDGGDEWGVAELVATLQSAPAAPPATEAPEDAAEESAETSQPAKLEEFGLAAEGRMPYQVTNRSLVPLVFDNLGEVGSDDVFVDFGCGKGRMLLAAAMQPFRRVVGIDISPELCEVARDNIERNRERLRCKDVEVIAVDATEFAVPDDMTVAYLYNPFQGEVFQRVLANIVASLERHPRRVRIVYLLPAMQEAILETKRFRVVKTVPFGDGPAQRVAFYETTSEAPEGSSETAPDGLPVFSLEVGQEEWERADRETRANFVHVAAGLEKSEFFGQLAPPAKEWALIDLDEYPDMEAFLKAARKVHTGNALRDARKAAERGYYSKFFDPRTFVIDLMEVDQSASERQGSAMAEHYRRTVEERGGYPNALHLPETPNQSLTWDRWFGVFRPDAGHTQGEVVVDERLLSYLKLRKVGPFLFYGTILGHADHLREGVMYKMHLDLVEYLLRNRELLAKGEAAADHSLEGTRLLGYARYSRQGEGLMMWKKRMLFRPGYVLLRYPDER